MVNSFKDLLESIFGSKKKPFDNLLPSNVGQNDSKRARTINVKLPPVQRDSYFIQVGLDFGTAYTKCICRDLNLGAKSWVVHPEVSLDSNYPFLFSSSISHINGSFQSWQREHSEEHVLRYLKMALDATSKKEKVPYQNYRNLAQAHADIPSDTLIKLANIYLLALILKRIRNHISGLYPGSHSDDYIAVNMAVPTASADRHETHKAFDYCLRAAWMLSKTINPNTSIAPRDLIRQLDDLQNEINSEDSRAACFIYPEVSANVQAFIRSRTASEGIYLFSDTGAGTVDQSVFIFQRANQHTPVDLLNYLSAKIHPLGSSQIELRAAHRSKDFSPGNIDRLRILKETGDNNAHLAAAKSHISKDLCIGTVQTLKTGWDKLIVKGQLSDLKILFGGGGHTSHPYAQAVERQLEMNPKFDQRRLDRRRQNQDHFVVGMPIPLDLELPNGKQHWLKRLTVAYGLSFERSDLATATLPHQEPVKLDHQIWKPKSNLAEAPSKDVC